MLCRVALGGCRIRNYYRGVGMHARASSDSQCLNVGCSMEHPYIRVFLTLISSYKCRGADRGSAAPSTGAALRVSYQYIF